MQGLSTVAVLTNSTKARVVKLWLEIRLIGGIRALNSDDSCKVGETKSCFWAALARSGGDHQRPK